ncbi:hypothetical protein QOZ80_6BG0465040 [Eleusine coracana subsp. coracana]|nr:hypothetical protein QOZ80_6BG0465040 [Eleusine coracana subsp. coracana]
MSATRAAGDITTADGDDRRRRELHAFDDTKAGVKGLVDAGVTSVPSIFHHPPDSLDSTNNGDRGSIPVVDLSAARREDVVARVRAAAETAGFFQVVNHGVAGEVMAGMLAAVRRFNEEPVEAKRPFYTRDRARKPPRPEEIPEALREVMSEYGAAVRKLALWLLELLSESLGLRRDHLREMDCAESLSVVSHYYPPHLTLGTSRHTDPAFLTVLLQDAMGGLQVLLDRGSGGGPGWVDVPPLPGALILVSNGRFKSVEHRVVANRSRDTPRISVASFFNTDMRTSTRLYGPIEELVSSDGGGEAPVYRSITVREYVMRFYQKGLDGRPALDYFKLEHHAPATIM